MANDPKPRGEEPNLWALAGVGMELAAGIGVLAFLGWWLDKRWDSSPWLTVAGAGLGVLGGLYNLWKQTRRYL